LNKTKQYQKAILMLEETVRLFPNYATAYNNLGAAFIHTKRYEQAVLALRSALDLEPDDETARYNPALAYLATQNKVAALEQYVNLKRTNEVVAQALQKLISKQIVFVKPN